MLKLCPFIEFKKKKCELSHHCLTKFHWTKLFIVPVEHGAVQPGSELHLQNFVGLHDV